MLYVWLPQVSKENAKVSSLLCMCWYYLIADFNFMILNIKAFVAVFFMILRINFQSDIIWWNDLWAVYTDYN